MNTNTMKWCNITYPDISIFESIQLFNKTLRDSILSSHAVLHSYAQLAINMIVSIKMILCGNSDYESLSDSMGSLYWLMCC